MFLRWAAAVRKLRQISDAFDGHVRSGILGNDLRVQGIVTLADEDSCDSGAPDCLYRREDAQLVVDEHIMFGGMALLDILEFIFFVNVNQDLAANGFEEARAIDFARL